MDTAVSIPTLAMEHGEQHVVHPFFRQALPKPPANPTQARSFFDLPSGDARCPNPEYGHETMPRRVGEGGQTSVPDPSNSEDDPNANRRKRRKTDKTKATEQEVPPQTGLSGWLGKDPIPSGDSTEPTSRPHTTAVSRPPSIPLKQQFDESVIEQQQHLTDHNTADGSSQRPRKILKLNTNGRLLSSPPLTTESSTDKSNGNKRGRSRKGASKLAVLKYDPNSPKNISSLIDAILQGSMTYRSPTCPAIRSSNHTIQSARPTHPFFLKKASQKSQPDSTVDTPPSNQPVNTNLSSQVERKRAPQAFPMQSSGIARRVNKFPELIHPVWPPQDLVHVRPLDTPSQIRTSAPHDLISDQKKSKLPTINITDEENVLLSCTAAARKNGKLFLKANGDYRQTLRHPTRNAASGRVLQTAIDSQLSSALPQASPSAYSWNPVIMKLRSALLFSVSAFDCGKYESQLWAHKYAPRVAEDVLQTGCEPQLLRDWLRHLKINAVDTGKSAKDGANSRTKVDKKRKTRRKPADKLDGFIVSSEEEASEMENLPGSDDELAGDVTVPSRKTVVRTGDLASSAQHGADKGRITNAILLSGPPGSGKTASVYAVAKELDYEVFEINPGSRRSARDMLERVGDMTQNHLVHLLNDPEDSSAKCGSNVNAKQNKLKGFFKSQHSKDTSTSSSSSQSSLKSDPETRRRREQKQSLILIEEADILYDEDKQFWTGVLTLISQSRRPIVITCNDESLVPTQGMSLHAILRYQAPPRDLAIDYLLLVAANEGHMLKREAVSKLYTGSRFDVRRSLMDLNLWCQIGVGSEKAGLDWILPQWPPGANVDQNGDRVRVLSLNTYESYMGWFNRDCFLEEEEPLERETDALKNSFHWWGLGIQESEDVGGLSKAELVSFDQFRSKPKLKQLQLLDHEADFAEMRSSLDILSPGCSLDMTQDVMDITAPPMLESHRSNYIDAYPLLQTDLLPEYTSVSENVSFTFGALLFRVFRPNMEDLESATATRIINGWAKSAARHLNFAPNISGFRGAFDSIRRANYPMPAPTGRVAASFENGLSPITEDIAPYVRAIMIFDGRLKQYRDNLHAIWAQEQGCGEKRTRTTRASRAALEGSDKATTRKERWFPADTNYFLVQGSGMPEWQHILFQMGHFHVQPVVEPLQEPEDHEMHA